MSKTALLFAGQGAQVVGMGKDLAEKFPSAKAWFDRANAALGYDLAAICFNGPEAGIDQDRKRAAGHFSRELGRVSIAQGTGAGA